MYPNQSSPIPLSHQNPSSQSFSGFYCGCGLLYKNAISFKVHVLHQHEGEYILNSSHTISQYTGSVYPCKMWNKEEMKVKMKKRDIQGCRHQERMRELSGHEEITEKQKQQRSKEDDLKLKETHEGDNSKNSDSMDIEQTRQFRLSICSGLNEVFLPPLPNCTQSSLSDAPVSLNYSVADQSQFENEKQSEYSDPRIRRKKTHKIRKATKSSLIKAPTKQAEKKVVDPLDSSKMHYFSSARGTFQIPSNMVMIFNLLRAKIRFEKQPQFVFQCGCGVNILIKNGISGRDMVNHIKANHHGAVPRNSSHIMLRRFVREGNFLYRLISAVQVNEELGWGCSCVPDVNMTNKQFVEHVQLIHGGVSVVYDFPTLKRDHKFLQH